MSKFKTVSFIKNPNKLPENGGVAFIQRIIHDGNKILFKTPGTPIEISNNDFNKMIKDKEVIEITYLNRGLPFNYTPNRCLCVNSKGELQHIEEGTYSNPIVIETFGNIAHKI